MPTYEYRCNGCAHGFELFQSIKSEPIKTCPKCGADAVHRVIGAGGGFIFKGSGFYITDYARSSDYKEKSKSDSSGSAGARSEKKESAPASGDGKTPDKKPTPDSKAGAAA